MSIFEEAKTAVMGAAMGAMQKAVELAPDRLMPGGTPDPLIRRQHGLIGAPVSRIDGPLKVAGQAKFAAEFAPAGMAYAALVYATIAKGRIAQIEVTAAQSAPGVALVMTHRNAPQMAAMPLFGTGAKACGGNDLSIFQDTRIHWNGQPIALVLAETQEQADHAASLIAVAYDTDPSVTSFAEGKAKGTDTGTFFGEALHAAVGDAEAALAAAASRVDAIYRTPRHNHNPIEPHACTVHWTTENGADHLHIHDATQAVAHAAWSIAQVFGLEEEQVRVTSPYVGGGFGSKTLWDHQILAAAASKATGRPVRLTLSREGVYRIVGGRTLTEQRVALGADAEGRFQAIVHTGAVASTAHNNMPEAFITGTKSTYASETFLLDVQVAQLDMLANTFMRAPGESVGTYALECAVDELAHEMGVDPIDLRLRNEPERDPISGTEWSSRNVREMWRMGAERFGWSARQAVPGKRREGEWLIGIGCATGTYPYNRMPGGAARLTLTRDGDGIAAHVEIAAHEMGMGTSTAQSQVAAERLGLPMERIRFDYGDSVLPGMVLAGGSQQTASIGAAVVAAQKALNSELLKLAGNASPLAGLSADEVEGVEGGLAKIGEPAVRDDYAAILARAGRDDVSVTAEGPPPLEAQHWSMHSWSAMFAEVRVNTVTGETRVDRLAGCFDCGRILNAKTAGSQFRGGIIMGLGLALMEETMFDERSGRIMNPSLAEYHVAAHLDVPAIDVSWTDIADPHAPMGARGVGEIGITGTAAAIANAIFNATGKRVRDLPITLDKLM